jgi:hypothetical protein
VEVLCRSGGHAAGADASRKVVTTSRTCAVRASPKKCVVPGNTASWEAGTSTKSPVHVPAAAPEEADRLLEGDRVAVTDGDEGRCGNRLDVRVGPATEALVERAELVQQVLQPLRMG